ncbi:MAG TPA: helical backbone metal receptor, partial [Methylomirabilota bacterium]
IALVRELGEVVGAEARGHALADALEARHRETRARLAGRRTPRVFYPIWRKPWMTLSRDTYAHHMLADCGGVNVFADRPERYPTITLDDVARAAPEVILLPDEPYRFRRVHSRDFEAYPQVPAVRDGRIHLVDGKLLTWYGPRIAEALEIVPALLGAR